MRKSKVRIVKKLYPKTKHNPGEFAIVSVSLVQHLEGEKPKTHRIYKNFSLVGIMPSFDIGDEFIVAYDNEEEKNGSYSYKVLHMTLGLDLNNPEMLFTFLQKTAGKSIAQEMIRVPNILSLLKDRNDKELLKIKGVGEKKLLNIYKNMDTKTDNVIAYAELGKYGITHNLIDKICNVFSSPVTAIQLVKNNPYLLVTKVNGVGFKKADEIAISIGFDINSPERIKAAIFHVMETEAQLGKTYLSSAQLLGELSNLLSIDKDLIIKCLKELQKDKIIFVANKGKEFGLVKYLELEKNIANELKRIKEAKSKIEVPENLESIIKKIEEKQGWEYTDEQSKAINQVLFENVSVVTGYAGCVDKDTEFFNGYEWKPISEYEKGDKVLQYNIDGTANLVEPLQYIKKECKEMTLVTSQDFLGEINQCLSDEHNFVFLDNNKINKKPFIEIKNNHNKTENGFKGKIITSFKYSGNGIDLTDNEIKLMVASILRGRFNDKKDFFVKIKIFDKIKIRKMEKLLNECNIQFEKLNFLIEGYTYFKFKNPLNEEYFSSYWYNCNNKQLELISKEILNWKRSLNPNEDLFLFFNKQTAEFIQFMWSALGYNSIIRENKFYYIVSKSENNLISINKTLKTDKLKMEKYNTIDGFKYCFEVPSNMLVLRRNNRIFITGNTGKTTVINAMTQILDGYLIKQCALSAKAAQRMKEVTGIESSTIHRLLGLKKMENEEIANSSQNTLPIDIVILDEASMVNGELFLQLLKAIPNGSKLIILGDIGQLQAIGSCAVLSDILNSNFIKSTQLTKIHRQAAASAIISKSIAIRHQEVIYEDGFTGQRTLGDLKDLDIFIYNKEYLQKYVLDSFEESMSDLDNIMEVQIVTPMKQRGSICTDILNKIIQQKYITTIGSAYKSRKHNCNIYVGDKVINLKNNYETFSPIGEKRPIANGNMGMVKSISENSIIIDFQGIGEVEIEGEARENINLAYAITIHSSQGSQFKNVIVAIDSASYIMGNVEILYTGITRAQKHCYLIAEPSIVTKCLKTVENKQKQTYLDRILNSFNENKNK